MTHESQKQDNCKWKKNSSFNYCFHSQKRPAIESDVAQTKENLSFQSFGSTLHC